MPVMGRGVTFEIFIRVCYTSHLTVLNKERTVVRCLSCNVELTDFESTRKSAALLVQAETALLLMVPQLHLVYHQT